jgi:Xaa-Pro aminopeptidase
MPPDASTSPATLHNEMLAKGEQLREAIERHDLGAIRLRGQDWFAWATCGGSNAVLMATDAGVAEVLATRDGIHVLTDAIEADRLRDEEVPPGLDVVEFAWADRAALETFAREAAAGGAVASDLHAGGERPLPASLVAAKRRLLEPEIERYRSVGRDAAEAMTETLGRATPEMTELEVSGIGADALLKRGLDPALILVAGSRRVDRHRHPRPTTSPVGERVEVVICGRRAGLFANLTRFAWFREPTEAERRTAMDVALVEADAFDATRPGATLGAVFAAITAAYARLGHPRAELDHHQGGTTGYRSREVIATPGDPTILDDPVAVAWNPSLTGAKIEDTVLLTDAGLEVLTLDPSWRTVEVAGRPRPDLLVRA